ncbi:MAG: acetyl-CoA hydrolase/transferase C-terminal domain-containing protein [Alphaproteobacteria bacterium]
MPIQLDASTLDIASLIRPGELVVYSDGSGEPVTLTEALIDQAGRVGPFRIFAGITLADTLSKLQSDNVTLLSYGGAQKYFDLFKRGRLNVVPTHLSQLARSFAEGLLAPDVALVVSAPPDASGAFNLGPVAFHMPTVIERARIVIAEVNPNVPWSSGDTTIAADRIDYVIHSRRPLAELVSRAPTQADTAIAENVVRLVPDRATIELGIGTIPDMIARYLVTKRDLGIHSGMLSDSIVDLLGSGAVTNRYKEIDTGCTVAGLYFGTPRLYQMLHRNPAVQVRESFHTHGARVLLKLGRFFAINSAVEVDLTGQVGAESIGGRYFGTVGGQGDFQRAAIHSAGGRGIVALPSATPDGRLSRIVAKLGGPVTTARADADVIVTEYGIAELRGRTLEERAAAMIAIAHPDHRAALTKAADDLV